MSNLLFTVVPIEQQETIIGGRNIKARANNVNDIQVKGNNNVVVVVNNITIINIIINVIICSCGGGRKHRSRRFS
ncbi:hypothetical protein FJR11_19945 [Anabaena sp. UHCC 0187]|uniref:hypothetical protein n=1 Tax=Anabaena sp. UHCC 0187 TaxID=2590018 RepID=UPI0014457E45|nr:hypothetical protein [Anabaena sp. UHCC 0187]MTJ14806.1 hypothetical protein [Anabaena sp. UHCC 0187]